MHWVCVVLPVTHFSCVPPPWGTPVTQDTQGCHHQTGSMFSLLVSSAPRALQGALAPTPGAPGPGSLGRPLSAFHPKPISHEVLGRDSIVCPQTGGFSQKILPWQRGNAWPGASSPCLGDIAAGELEGQEAAPCLDHLIHVAPLGERVCQCMSCSMHGGCATVHGLCALTHTCACTVAGCAVCVLPVCMCTLQACSAALCSLSPHAPHTVQAQHTQPLHTHCRLHAYPVPALQVQSYAL